MPLTTNQMHFFISYAVAFLIFGLIAKWYIWPEIKDRGMKPALTPLLLYACLRVKGLMFLIPGLVSPELPSAFAIPTAYGDLTAVILALLRSLAFDLIALRCANTLAVQYGRASRLNLREHLDIQGSSRSHPARRCLLSGGYQRSGHGGRSRTDLCLFAEATTA